MIDNCTLESSTTKIFLSRFFKILLAEFTTPFKLLSLYLTIQSIIHSFAKLLHLVNFFIFSQIRIVLILLTSKTSMIEEFCISFISS